MSHSPCATFDLGGKLALITGASRGIGAATARLLARHGARIIVTSRNAEACEDVARDIRDDGGQAEADHCHIGDPDQIDALFARIRDRHGRLDILVNNAATNPHYGPILDTDLAAFQKTVDVNLRGYFLMSGHGARLIAASGGGSIVNVASVNGVRPAPMQGIYSITKAAVIAMTRSFALECAPLGVRVNALLPGLTDTRFAEAMTSNPKIMNNLSRLIPLGRAALPEEMAGAILFLVSPAASYATASNLVIDGGYLA